MLRTRVLLFALLLAACGGGQSGPSPEPGPATPDAAVRRFMQAASDSNLPAMANIWGTEKGAAGRTGQPPDYLKRMQVTQLYLQHVPYKVVRIQPYEDDPRRQQVDVAVRPRLLPADRADHRASIRTKTAGSSTSWT